MHKVPLTPLEPPRNLYGIRMGLYFPCLEALPYDTFLYAGLAGDHSSEEKVRL